MNDYQLPSTLLSTLPWFPVLERSLLTAEPTCSETMQLATQSTINNIENGG